MKCFLGNIIDVQVTTSDESSIRQALEKRTQSERELWIDAIMLVLDSLKSTETWK